MRTSPPELTAEYRRRGAWTDTRITDLFDTAVRVNPLGLAVADAPNRALLCGDAARRLSFTELQQLVSQYLLRFIELGLEREHILITQLPNIAEYTAVYVAALKLGVILSPVPIQFGRGDLKKIMRLTDARALLTVAKFKGAEPALDAMAAAQGLGVQVLVLGDHAPAGAFALTPRAVSTAEQQSLEARSRCSASPPTTSQQSAGPRARRECRRVCRVLIIIGLRSPLLISEVRPFATATCYSIHFRWLTWPHWAGAF